MKRLIFLLILGYSIFALGQSPVNIIDAGNSTTTNLGSGKTFTGVGYDLVAQKLFASISVYVTSNKASATGGLKIQFSTNNTLFYTSDSVSISANTPYTLFAKVKARYYRVVYVNTTDSITANFSIQTILHEQNIGSDSTKTYTSASNNATLAKAIADSLISASKLSFTGNPSGLTVTSAVSYIADGSGDIVPVTDAAGEGLPIQINANATSTNIFLDSLAAKIARKTLTTTPLNSYMTTPNDTLGQSYADSTSNGYFQSLYTFAKIIYQGSSGDSCVVENYDTVSGTWYAVGVRSSLTDQVSQYIIPTSTATILYTLAVPKPRTLRVRRYNVISRINTLAYVRYVGNN